MLMEIDTHHVRPIIIVRLDTQSPFGPKGHWPPKHLHSALKTRASAPKKWHMGLVKAQDTYVHRRCISGQLFLRSQHPRKMPTCRMLHYPLESTSEHSAGSQWYYCASETIRMTITSQPHLPYNISFLQHVYQPNYCLLQPQMENEHCINCHRLALLIYVYVTLWCPLRD